MSALCRLTPVGANRGAALQLAAAPGAPPRLAFRALVPLVPRAPPPIACRARPQILAPPGAF